MTASPDRNEVRADGDRDWLAAIAVVLMVAAGLFGMWVMGLGV